MANQPEPLTPDQYLTNLANSYNEFCCQIKQGQLTPDQLDKLDDLRHDIATLLEVQIYADSQNEDLAYEIKLIDLSVP